jgi:hypothetical protein
MAGMSAVKIKLENEVRELHALFPPLIIQTQRFRSTREVAIVTGITDRSTRSTGQGRDPLEKRWDSTWTPPARGRGGGPLCPGGQTATPTIDCGRLDTPSTQSLGMFGSAG